ncbi:gamma-secretase-activating protein isoform X2 [Eublepharis macularius]|uniref:Gamma-secretase-activating protein isoform X2 n=1 Tax=Eublepharis macularius TaxID=481883 RepID=A0AA97JWD3_EUBMA|nr:gamma-secretase-activating protein isoform X2 [Eublepharis macularius]
MLLRLRARFDPRRDAAPWLAGQPLAADADAFLESLETLYVVNVERNGNIIYTWKGTRGHTCIGLYDPNSQTNEHLYTFEKDLHVISCSVNNEKTLLAVSFLQSTKEVTANLLFQPVSKCLTLLIEICPINNVKVLKAVDNCIRVQFLYPVAETQTFPESCLLLISEDKYVEKFDIRIVKEGHTAVIENSSHLPKEKIADDFLWIQWDTLEQRLFYVGSRDILNCVQFYPDKSFTLILEVPLEISLPDIGFKLLNLKCDYYQGQEVEPQPLNLHVFTNERGSFCICYCIAPVKPGDVTYSAFFLHKGYSKTYTVALERTDFLQVKDLTFLNLDYYVAVFLPGHFLHLLNTQHPDLMCCNFFLTGEDAKINGLHKSAIVSPLKSMVLDLGTGQLFALEISKQGLLQFLWNSKRDSDRLATLHCLLLYIGNTTELETEIIKWISENMSTCFTFDPVQEFIIASLYWRMCPEAVNLDKLLPYTSLGCWNEPIPGITCTTHIISLPVLKAQNCKGFWEKLISSLEYVKYAGPPLRFNSKVLQRELEKLHLDQTDEGKRLTMYFTTIFEYAKKVLSNLNTRSSEERLVPFFQDEDYQQQLQTGLMAAQLKDHLMRHLQYVGKKRIEQIAVDYVSKLLGLMCRIMENVWRKYNLDSWVFYLGQQGGSNEALVFHLMCRMLQAANEMCLPLPPGFHTLHTRLGVRCLPLYTLLHYIDQGVLHLTELCVLNLLKELDNTEKNEKLKLGILARLPEAIGHKVAQLPSHPLGSSTIVQTYIKLLLEKLGNKRPSTSLVDRSPAQIEFLPLNYLVTMLAEVDHQVVFLRLGGFRGTRDCEFETCRRGGTEAYGHALGPLVLRSEDEWATSSNISASPHAATSTHAERPPLSRQKNCWL